MASGWSLSWLPITLTQGGGDREADREDGEDRKNY
jgi:hypothetical protein